MEKIIELLLDGEIICIENVMPVEDYICGLWEDKDGLDCDLFKEALTFANKYTGKDLYIGSYFIEEDCYELTDVVIDEDMIVVAEHTYL